MWDKNPQPREQQKEIMAKHKFKCSSCGAGSPETFLFIREDSSCTRKKRKGLWGQSGASVRILCRRVDHRRSSGAITGHYVCGMAAG